MRAERFLLGCFISLFLISFALAQAPCNSLGYINGSEYCDSDGFYHQLKAGGEVCDNNYECANYSCKEGFCQSKYVHMTLNLTEQQSLLNEIWNFIWGIKCNPINQSYHCEGDRAFLCGVNGVWEPEEGMLIPGECGIPLYTCGDGVVEAPYEQCDDGNSIDEDACYNCVINICGDTVINSGVEECDDGANGIIGDGCTDTCLAETCTLAEMGTTICIGYYNSTCEGNLIWHPADNMTIGECGVECLSLWSESCTGQELLMCNESYVWSNYGLVNGKCGYSRPSGGGGGHGGHGDQGINIIIYSPLEGITYGNSIIPLLVDDLGDLAEFWKYSLNGAKKISFTPNASVTIASEGYNTLIIYAREEFKTTRETAKAVNFRVVFPPASQPGYCGDTICRDSETCESCSLDCGECITESVLVCGDGICDVTESSYECIDDCEAGERSIVVAVITVIVLILLLGGLGFFLYKKFFEDAFRRWKLLDPRAEKVLRA